MAKKKIIILLISVLLLGNTGFIHGRLCGNSTDTAFNNNSIQPTDPNPSTLKSSGA